MITVKGRAVECALRIVTAYRDNLCGRDIQFIAKFLREETLAVARFNYIAQEISRDPECGNSFVRPIKSSKVEQLGGGGDGDL